VLEVLERGDIQLVFRPTVQAAEADSYALGVQSLFLILSPAGGRTHRRVRVGKKRLPANPRERFWARVERVGTLQHALGNLLEPEQYSTKTRGERYQPAARPIARGSYTFVRHDDHVHLRYELEPFAFEEAPEEVRFPPDGDHLVLFESLASDGPTWTPTGDPARLDAEGAEIVLVGSNHAAPPAKAGSG
jgi:hypothetical protein